MQTTSLFGNISACPFISTIIIGNNNKKGQVRATLNPYEASPGSSAKWLRGAANMHPEGGTQGDEDKFFVLMTKGVTVVSSHARTHLLLPFLFPRRRSSQEAGEGVLLLKRLCQGEEEDERGGGISRALAAQDSPSSSLHHIEVEMPLHPELRNAHQGGEKGAQEPRRVFPLQSEAASLLGAEEAASSLGARGSKRWPHLATGQGRAASQPARRGPAPSPWRGPSPPAPVTSAPSPPGSARRPPAAAGQEPLGFKN